jgi:hypothetical protein
MANDIMTDEQVEQEISKLLESDLVKLAKKEKRIKERRKQYLYNLRTYERRGRQLAAEGYTLENIAERMLGDIEDIDEEKEQPKEDGQKEPKKRAIFKHFDGHDCETWYTCPYCGKTFGEWEVFRQKQNENGTKRYCPYCKKEFAGQG